MGGNDLQSEFSVDSSEQLLLDEVGEQPVDQLCPPCARGLFCLPETVGTTYGDERTLLHYRRLRDLWRSALRGCFFCKTCWSQVIREGCYANLERCLSVLSADMSCPDHDYELIISAVELGQEEIIATDEDCSINDLSEDLMFMLDNEQLDSKYPGSWFQMRPVEIVDHGASSQLWPHSVAVEAGSTLGQASLKTAKQWVKDCLDKHVSCSKLVGPSQYSPSRLLEITLHSTGITVSLRDCRAGPISDPYTTLSHEWGTASFLQLRLDNLKAFEGDIPFERLSKTFQDGIAVTLQLGYKYIWIDSLCIMQDSTEDWLKESATMKDVYTNSILTISATGQQPPGCGLESYRDWPLIGSIVRDVRLESGTSRTTKCRIRDRDLWYKTVLDAPINKRGWVLQERLLSRRILHCAHEQLAWECDELEACEVWPMGFPELPSDMNYHQDLFRSCMKPGLSNPADADDLESDKLASMWRRVVSMYTSCRLTKESDILVALSGIAAYFQAYNKDTYLAGLWKGSFVETLGWDALGPIIVPERRHAPSWSWASVIATVSNDNPLSVPNSSLKLLAELLTADITLVDPANPTGAVKDGYAVLRGRVIACSRRSPVRGRFTRRSYDLVMTNGQELCPQKDFDLDLFPDSIPDFPEYVQCLPLYWSKGRTKTGHEFVMTALVLSDFPSDTHNLGYRTFQRAGSCWLKFKRREHVNEFLRLHNDKQTITIV